MVPHNRYPPGSAEPQLPADLQSALQARSLDRRAEAEKSQRQNRLRQQWMEARM